jgi:hypothetical protein
MLVPRVVNMRMVDDDIFVRRKRNPDVDLEAGAMAMLVAWRDNGYAASRDAPIVGFQPFDLFQYRLTRRRRWLGALEGDLWCYLHCVPVFAVMTCDANPLLAEWLHRLPPKVASLPLSRSRIVLAMPVEKRAQRK